MPHKKSSNKCSLSYYKVVMQVSPFILILCGALQKKKKTFITNNDL